MGLLDVVCPTRCCACGTPGRLVCDPCSLVLVAPAVRHLPTPCPTGMPPTWVVAAYDGPARELLLQFKEHGRVGLARPLGEALARSVSRVVGQHMSAFVVPVPSSPAAVKRRGDDVVRLLAGRAVMRLRRSGRRVRVAAVLQQRRQIADSAGLSAEARAANLSGALEVRPSAQRLMRGAAVVLVDDLVTTGATLSEAAAALARAGAHVLGAGAVAATRRRSNW